MEMALVLCISTTFMSSTEMAAVAPLTCQYIDERGTFPVFVPNGRLPR